MEEEQVVSDSNSDSDDDKFVSEGEAKKEEVLDASEFPCHGIPGSSVYVNGRCLIYRQPPMAPANMRVRYSLHEWTISYRHAVRGQFLIGTWESCYEEVWDLPEADEVCLLCNECRECTDRLRRLVGQEDLNLSTDSNFRDPRAPSARSKIEQLQMLIANRS
ncbi:hypothetical protein TSAR_001309 [Trichomalopsis sarcophagae]|uniref:Uncharacterized protein n=1 Tax=Trichomalopsis sarcophagae TaxID=543379 RepID=A0A232FK50_9HYME|nr:hypothetical protein TSAR_001309 [Trichomalopsis sarcophagae]